MRIHVNTSLIGNKKLNVETDLSRMHGVVVGLIGSGEMITGPCSSIEFIHKESEWSEREREREREREQGEKAHTECSFSHTKD